MINFNIHEIAINPANTFFLSSQGFENIISFGMAIITLVALYFAIKTYRSDVEQKRKTNTLEYLNNFEYGNWISETDKSNWNFMYERLERKSCGDFDFTDRFVSRYNPEEDLINEYSDVIGIFSEGEYSHYGKSVIAVMKILEFIAKETNESKLDFNLISLKLLRFCQLASHYHEILDTNNPNKTFQDEFYPQISKLYKKLSNLFSGTKPFLNYCTFQLPQRFLPPKQAKAPR